MKTIENQHLKELQKQFLLSQKTNQNLQKTNQNLQKTNQELQKQNHYLQEQLDWLKKQVFGKKSERIISPNSDQLFFEGFENLEKDISEETKPVKAHKRIKSKRTGKDAINLPDDLPTETITLDVPEEKKVCKETGLPLKKIGEEVSCKLACKPESYFIKKFVRPKYALPNNEGIAIAEMPDSIILKCRADESFLADIVVKKYGDYLPLYRICEILERDSISISRKLLSQWIIKIAIALLPLYNEMKKQSLSGNNIFIDETPVKMLEKIKCKQTYLWVLATEKYRLYAFKENRNHKNVTEIISNYNGVLHSDKYGAYEKLANEKKITWCPCWAHIRRKFVDIPEESELKKEILEKIRDLFMLEREALEKPGPERLLIRKEKEIPIIDDLIQKVKKELLEGKTLPKSKMKQALGYFYSLVPYLKNYTKYPNARLDNNTAERAIRSIAIGRKNWLFLGSPNGGKAAAILMSFVQTCRNLSINPREYLEDVMRRIMSHKTNKLHELLPDQWKKLDSS
jgi:transposase